MVWFPIDQRVNVRFELSFSYLFLMSMIHRECTTSQFDLTTDNFSFMDLASKSPVAEVEPWLLFLTWPVIFLTLFRNFGMYVHTRVIFGLQRRKRQLQHRNIQTPESDTGSISGPSFWVVVEWLVIYIAWLFVICPITGSRCVRPPTDESMILLCTSPGPLTLTLTWAITCVILWQPECLFDSKRRDTLSKSMVLYIHLRLEVNFTYDHIQAKPSELWSQWNWRILLGEIQIHEYCFRELLFPSPLFVLYWQFDLDSALLHRW